jgi:hypothetical protein
MTAIVSHCGLPTYIQRLFADTNLCFFRQDERGMIAHDAWPATRPARFMLAATPLGSKEGSIQRSTGAQSKPIRRKEGHRRADSFCRGMSIRKWGTLPGVNVSQRPNLQNGDNFL